MAFKNNQNSHNNIFLYKLYREYGEAYSPLILPKLSKYGFGIRTSPTLISFVAKIKMYDVVTVKKENWIINKVKMVNKIASKT